MWKQGQAKEGQKEGSSPTKPVFTEDTTLITTIY